MGTFIENSLCTVLTFFFFLRNLFFNIYIFEPTQVDFVFCLLQVGIALLSERCMCCSLMQI